MINRIFLPGGHASVVQQLLELPNGMIDYGEVNGKGQTGYSAAHENGQTAILEILANAGHSAVLYRAP